MTQATYAYMATSLGCVVSPTQFDADQLSVSASKLEITFEQGHGCDSKEEYIRALERRVENLERYGFACNQQILRKAANNYIRYGAYALLAGKSVAEAAKIANGKLRPVRPNDARLKNVDTTLPPSNSIMTPIYLRPEIGLLVLGKL